jgi:dephospho-CoA kinase
MTVATVICLSSLSVAALCLVFTPVSSRATPFLALVPACRRSSLLFYGAATMATAKSDAEALVDASPTDAIRLLGICGGIGSGKSAACKLFVSDLNCLAHIDSDSIAHTVYEPGSLAIRQIVEEFGSNLLLENGELDRKKLGAIVFADTAEATNPDGTLRLTPMQRLERIVWPHVQTKIDLEVEAVKAKLSKKDESTRGKLPIIVIEAAVLLDAGWQSFLDGVWVVAVSKNVAMERLQQNRGLTESEAEQRIAAQQPRRGIGNLADEVDAGVVTAVIENNGSVEELKHQLAEKLVDARAWYAR